jgi:hypothetical protein
MEHDELSDLWQKYDARLDELTRTNELLLRRSSLAVAQTALGRLSVMLRLELAIDVLAVFFLGDFAAAHVRELPILLATAALDAFAIAILAATIAQLRALAAIDYDQPVIAIARAVERLRLLRARKAVGILAFASLMWVPLLIVGLRGLLGVDPIAALGVPYFAANAALGAAVLAGALWAARRYAGSARPLWLRYFNETLSGAEVRAASKQLAALARYDTDESTAA